PAPGGPPRTIRGLAAAGPRRGVPPPPRTPAATPPAPYANRTAPTAPRRAAARSPPAGRVRVPKHRRVPHLGPQSPWCSSALGPARSADPALAGRPRRYRAGYRVPLVLA